jgi:hypothetical protein
MDTNKMEEIRLDSLPSTNFGPGVELLMNGKKKEAPEEIKLTDLDKLETELNDLSSTVKLDVKDFPKMDFPKMEEKKEPVEFKNIQVEGVRFEDKKTVEPKTETNKSWDGFKSLNAVDPDKEFKPQLTPEELLRSKFKYLRKLEELEAKGINLTKKYSMESNLSEMQGEYENIVSERERLNNVKFQGKMLMACITGIEFLNSKFDPFDIKLDGWAEQVNENIEDYDDIFSELHEKYRSKAKLAPELKLLFQLGGSAIMLHMTNTMFKSAIPGMDDIMRQNPDLMNKFTQAAVNSVGSTHPGFSGFMNTVVKEAPVQRAQPKRPEMKGPSDINDILGGLKKVNMDHDEGSTVSLTELNDMKADLGMPKAAKKRTKSDKNSISLAI